MTAGALLIVLSSIALTVPAIALAEEVSPVQHYAWETECRHPLPEDAGFTAQEKWAWNKRLCLGKTAKMSDYGGGDGQGCEAKEADAWPDTRRLSEKFLRTILFHEPFKSAPPRPHVRIVCALFDEKIDISNFDLENEVWLDQSRFKKKVDLRSLRAQRAASFEASVFDDVISLSDAKIDGHLVIRNANFKQQTILQAAKIGGQLRARGARFDGSFTADNLEVKGYVYLDGASLKQASLLDAKIGLLSANGARFDGSFTADNLEVKGPAFLDGASFKQVRLLDAKIGLLSANGATFEGLFDADRLVVTSNVHFEPSERGKTIFKQGIRLLGAKIDGQLNARGATFEGPFRADGLEVKGHAFFDGATFKKVRLLDAKIGLLSANGATFERLFAADRLMVTSNVHFEQSDRGKTIFKQEVNLLTAKIGGQLRARGARFDSSFTADNLEVKGDVYLDGASLKQASLLDAKIGLLSANGATFEGLFAADRLVVTSNVDFRQSDRGKTIFKQGIDLPSAKIDGQLIASAATFEGPFTAYNLEVKEDVFLDGASFKQGIDLLGAKIDGQLIASAARFDGPFTAGNLEVKGDVYLDQDASFKGVSLGGAKIGFLSTSGATFAGLFKADAVEVKGHLILAGDSFKQVNLVGAKIGGPVSACNARFEGVFDARHIEVGRLAFLTEGADFQGKVNFSGSQFKSRVQLDSSAFHNRLDFTGTTIKGEFILDSDAQRPPRWSHHAQLILRNASVGALQESPVAWCMDGKQDPCGKAVSESSMVADIIESLVPVDLQGYIYEPLGGVDLENFVPVDLEGFTYQRLAGLESTGARDAMATREMKWLRAWLGAQPDHGSRYIPQPYTHLAQVLRETGNPAKADEIQYYLREHERTAESTSWPMYFWLTLQKWLIGYGYHNDLALFWFALLVLAGVWFCSKVAETDKLTKLTEGQKVWYSLDRALPLVNLGATEGVDPPSNWVAYYFYVHRIIGFVLATFLAAGLSGLTK